MLTGPPPKQNRQRRNKVNQLPLRTEEEAAVIPDPPEWLSLSGRELWDKLWKSDLARAVNPQTDMPAILRLFTLYDERERLNESWKKSPLVSKDPIKVNPFRDVIAVCDEQILKLQDRFGLNPMSRLRLGFKSSKPDQSKPSRASTEVRDPRKVLKAV